MDSKNLAKSLLEGADVRQTISAAASEASVDEASVVTKKEVHGGKVVKRRHLKTHKKRILTAAQKKAIKKAQRASQKGSAKTKRKKSLNKRAAFESEEEDEALRIDAICPECGNTSLEVLDSEDADVTIFVCPECGKEFVLVDADTAEEYDDDYDWEDEDEAAEGSDEGEPDETVESKETEDDSEESEDDETEELEPLYFED